MKMIKKDWGCKQEINTETYPKKKKFKKENIEKIEIAICLNIKKKELKEYQKNVIRQEILNIIVNKIFFKLWSNNK